MTEKIPELKNKPSAFEEEFIRLIEKLIKDRLVELGSKDIQLIVEQLMPDIDKMISDKVKEHLGEIGKYLSKKYS